MNKQSFKAFEADIIRCNEQQSLTGGNQGHSTNTSEGTFQMPSIVLGGSGPGDVLVDSVKSIFDTDEDGDWVSEC